MSSVRTDGPQANTGTSIGIAHRNAIKVRLHVIPESKFQSILLHFNIISYNALTIAMATSLAVTPGR